MQNDQANPFVRGYSNLRYRRLLLITYADDCPPCYLPLHDSQAHLLDDEVQCFPCLVSDTYALVTEGQMISEQLEDECSKSGIVLALTYEVTADDFGVTVHVADVPSPAAATELIKRLTFETGHFSRAWEISSVHLPDDNWQQLQELADAMVPTGLNFECFSLPESDAIGCKLFSTPWTDEHLQAIEGTDYLTLQKQQLDMGIPEALVRVLEMAGKADIRFLVLDPNAAILDGLQTYLSE